MREIEIDGRRQCLAAWCREFGISPQLVCLRVRSKKLSYEEALRMPIHVKKSSINR